MLETVIADGQRSAAFAIRLPPVITQQLHNASASNLRLEPQRVRGTCVRTETHPLEILILRTLLPFDTAGLPSKRESRQGLVGQTVALEGGVWSARPGEMSTHYNRRP